MPRIILEEQISQFKDNKENKRTLRKVFKTKTSDANYVKFHISNIEQLLSLNMSGAEYNLFIKIFEFLNYDNIVVFSRKTKDIICKSLNITSSSLRRLKSQLVKKNILIATKYRDEFIMNPMFVTKQTLTKTMDLIDNLNSKI